MNMTTEEDKKEGVEGQIPPAKTGRETLLEAYRTENPDGEPDDEALFTYANDRHGRMSGMSDRLSQRVAEDPRAGAMLSQFVGEGKSLPYAMGSVYGRE